MRGSRVSAPAGARSALIAGNWKMHKLAGEARSYVEELRALIEGRAPIEEGRVEVVICPPFTALHAASQAAHGSSIAIFAQNIHQERSGAFTGEISAAMAREAGASGVLLGHSERRAFFAESDRTLAAKLPAALAGGLTPVLCVGESEEQRNADETERTLRHQVGEALGQLPDDQLAEVAIAYEPLWAIGTGNVAEPDQVEEAASFIRALIAARSRSAAERARVLYGGSVSEQSAPEILALEDVDGLLVGGASLQPERFAAIVAAAG